MEGMDEGRYFSGIPVGIRDPAKITGEAEFIKKWER